MGNDMADRQVTCVVRAPPSHAIDIFITHIGGSWGKISEDEAIYEIESWRNTYYANINGQRADIQVVKGINRKFLKTLIDHYIPNNLLSLPSCP